jgi:hypothetical protein
VLAFLNVKMAERFATPVWRTSITELCFEKFNAERQISIMRHSS